MLCYYFRLFCYYIFLTGIDFFCNSLSDSGLEQRGNVLAEEPYAHSFNEIGYDGVTRMVLFCVTSTAPWPRVDWHSPCLAVIIKGSHWKHQLLSTSNAFNYHSTEYDFTTTQPEGLWAGLIKRRRCRSSDILFRHVQRWFSSDTALSALDDQTSDYLSLQLLRQGPRAQEEEETMGEET